MRHWKDTPPTHINTSTGRPSRKIQLVCEWCSSAFTRYPSEVAKGPQRFCSRSCYNAHHESGNTAAACPTCGNTFRRWASKEKIGTGVYCSAKCRDVANGKLNIARHPRAEKTCETCGAIFEVIPARATTARFCSGACKFAATTTWVKHGKGTNAFRGDLGHRCRSTWEANVCRVLVALGIVYEYEPKTFVCGKVRYTPDLWVPEWDRWIEVKGWLSEPGAAKIRAFRHHFPEHRLQVIDQPVYRAIESAFRPILRSWEP
jgi:hypothetical protein